MDNGTGSATVRHCTLASLGAYGVSYTPGTMTCQFSGLATKGTATRSINIDASSLCLMERAGVDYPVRLLVWYKTADPDVAMALLKRFAELLRAAGKRINVLTVDASNELFLHAGSKSRSASSFP